MLFYFCYVPSGNPDIEL